MKDSSAARWLLLGLTAASLVLLGVAPASAAPRCFGKPATIVGTRKSDFIKGTAGNDVIVGLGGSDHIVGKGGIDRICGGDGSDQELVGGPGRDWIFGGAKYDSISGGKGSDILKGGSGLDDMSGDADRDSLFGGPGADSLGGGAAHDLLAGGPGNDEIGAFGVDEGNDTGSGDEGDDVLRHSARSDLLDGGPGFDLIDAFGDQSGVTIDLAAGTSTGAGKGTASLTGIEAARGSDYDDVLAGNDGDNVFTPIYGDDTIDGGPGRDLVNFDRFEDSVFTGLTIDLGAGTAEGAGSDTLIAIEDVQGSEGPDVIRGNGENNLLMGFYGDDTLEGLAGDDVLDGDLLGDSLAFETKDIGDGGAHIAGDVCVDIEQATNCESATPERGGASPWYERFPVWLLGSTPEPTSGGRRI
jgi:Ca2+-binding RTX toxin-like protein